MTVKEAYDDFCFAKNWERATRAKRNKLREDGQRTGDWVASELAEKEFVHAVEHLAKAAEQLAETCLRAMTEVLNERERIESLGVASAVLHPLFRTIDSLKAS